MLPLFVLGHFGHHLLTALPIPLLPMIRSDFGLDYTRAGLVVSAFNLAYGIGQVPAGWITDRVGARIMITIGICGVAVAGFLVGLAPTYWALITFMGLMGLMGGGYHPAAPPVIAAAVEPKKLGRGLGLHMIGGSASYFLAPIIAAGIAAFWGWRGAFMGLAAPTILFGIFFYIALGRITAKKGAAGAPGAQADAPAEPGRLRRLVVFITLSTLTQAVMFSVLSFTPLYIVDRFSASEETAAAFIAIYYVTGLWTGPLAGHFSDRWGAVPLILAVCFVAGPIIFLFGVVPYKVVLGVLMLLLGMVSYVRMPVSEVYIVGQTSAHNRSMILGIYYFSSMEGGGVLAPLIGYLIDRMGFFSAFSISGVFIFVTTMVCSIWLWGRRD
ncbi:MAG: MFS transporter [Deltaproteobacteria bacterium]|nr:MFS transporter [Deltaproteobacteria bacterium]